MNVPRISSLHDDLLWPKVSHECGLAEYRANGVRAAFGELSILGRLGQFGADHLALDDALLAKRGEGYDEYVNSLATALNAGYETVVAAIFDRHTLEDQRAPDGSPRDPDAFEQSVREALDNHGHFSLCGLTPVTSGREIAAGRVNVILGVEGMDFVRRAETIDSLLAAGVRVFGLQYNRTNALGVNEDGLTGFGRIILEKVLAAHAVIDLAHSAPAVRRDVLELARACGCGAQVGYTHGAILDDATPESAARSPNRYLLPGEAERIVGTGGIVGLTPARPFVRSLEVFADRIDALCQSSGDCGHIALGTDFGGLWPGMFLPEVKSVKDFGRIAEILVARNGFHEAQVDRVLRTNATNWMRHALSDTTASAAAS